MMHLFLFIVIFYFLEEDIAVVLNLYEITELLHGHAHCLLKS